VAELPDKPNLEWLRKQAKRRLAELRRTNAEAQLADAQFNVARDLGFSSWRELKAHVDSFTIDGQIIVAARDGDATTPVREFLSAAARAIIFSAIGARDPDAVRRIVAENPAALTQRQSRNENNRTPLHFAVAMNRPDMVVLLIELGADPLAVDAWGMPAAGYATRPDIDRPIAEKIRTMMLAEVISAARGHRTANMGVMDLVACLALQDWPAAERLVRDNPQLIDPSRGALHLMAKRGDADAVTWLLTRGADPNGRWRHFDADVTALHLACLAHHPDVARALLDGGADPLIHDSKHDADAMGWAQFFKRAEIVQMLKKHATNRSA
jgi:hypothetical protein